jgi:hypothetical protein
MEVLRTNRLAFAFFAIAIMFSMVREWNAPLACARGILVPATTPVAAHDRR